MLFVQKFIVLKHERGLLFRDGDFVRFLEPGTYRFPGLRQRYSVERFDLAEPLFEHRLADYLVEAERVDVERLFTLVETGASEVAVVYRNARFAEIVGPAERKLYWRGPVEVRVERFDLDAGLAVDAKLVRQLPDTNPLRGFGTRGIYSREVPDGHVGLLYVDGKLTGSLAPGAHAFWTYGPAVKVDVVGLRVKTLDVQGQEILTRDKVSLRVNLTATYRFVDAEKAVRAAKDPLDHLYKEMQFGLRAAVGTRTLDALLEDKSVIDRIVAERVGERFADIGIAVESVGIKDIILPGDIKQPYKSFTKIDTNTYHAYFNKHTFLKDRNGSQKALRLLHNHGSRPSHVGKPNPHRPQEASMVRSQPCRAAGRLPEHRPENRSRSAHRSCRDHV